MLSSRSISFLNLVPCGFRISPFWIDENKVAVKRCRTSTQILETVHSQFVTVTLLSRC